MWQMIAEDVLEKDACKGRRCRLFVITDGEDNKSETKSIRGKAFEN